MLWDFQETQKSYTETIPGPLTDTSSSAPRQPQALGCSSPVRSPDLWPRKYHTEPEPPSWAQSIPRTVDMARLLTILILYFAVACSITVSKHDRRKNTFWLTVEFSYSWVVEHMESQWNHYFHVNPQAKNQQNPPSTHTPSLRGDRRTQHHPSSEWHLTG